eukprot:UN01936
MSDTEKNTNEQTIENTTNPNAKYVMNSAEDQEEKKEVSKTADKKSSTYYLYKSTDKEEAKKYAPKKLDNSTAQKVETAAKSASKGSTWNTGATMEQFDYSAWMKDRIKQLLLGLTFANSSIKITEVVKVDGSATILLIRGKYRPGYDISFECKWKGYIEANYVEPPENSDDSVDKIKEKSKKASGTLKMNEITSEDDPEDWEYEVSIKKKSKVNREGGKLVKKDRENVINAINIFVKELKVKK